MVVHENEWYWFAGLYEGEGFLRKTAPCEPRRFRLSIAMTDLDVLQKAGKLVGHNYIYCRKYKDQARKDLYELLLRGKTAVRTMMTIQPILGERRQQQIQKMLDLSDWETEPFLQLSMPARDSEAELYWLAGLIEGEGSFMIGSPQRPNQSKIKLWMTDEDIVARVANIWGQNYYRFDRGDGIRKVAYVTIMQGAKAVELMQKLRPLMGERRQAQIDRVIASYDPDYERKGRIKGNITKAKLNPGQVREVRKRIKKREDYWHIANDYGVQWHVINDIARRKTWA